MNTKERAYYQWAFRFLSWLFAKAFGFEPFRLQEIQMKYIIKNDQPDFGFKVIPGEVRDAEGEVIPNVDLDMEVLSSDENVLQVTTSPDSDESGSVHVGTSGESTITVNASHNGKLLATGSDTFLVTTSDPTSVSGIRTEFEGLAPVDEAPPV